MDGYNKDSQIRELKNEVSQVQDRLSKAQSDLKGKAPLERLKDLESENEALQAYSSIRPNLQQDLKGYEKRKEQAYRLGDRLVELKRGYQQIMTERHQSIEKTKDLEDRIKECDAKKILLIKTNWTRKKM